MIWQKIICIVVGYVFGLFQTGFIIGKMHNIDIREHLWDKYLFISRKGGNKASGVKRLCDYFRVSMSETITIGDDRNDIDMLEEAGLGVAMGNAQEDIQKIADYVTASNEQNGAALALEKFFLKKWGKK